MPRKPSHRSIVREIREWLGWTQAKLARHLGTTMITVNRIENGSLNISRRLALRLSWSTGISYRDIMKNAPGKPQSWDGQDWTPAKTKQLEQKARTLSDEQREAWLAQITHRARLVLGVILRDQPYKFWSLTAAISESFDQIEEEFRLRRKIKPKAQAPSKRQRLRVLSGSGNGN